MFNVEYYDISQGKWIITAAGVSDMTAMRCVGQWRDKGYQARFLRSK